MTDLQSKVAIYSKAVMFLIIGLTSAFLLLAQNFTAQTLVLICLAIWGFSRAYYFAFYVIEHYVNPTFRFSGLLHFFKYLLKSHR